MVCYLLSVLVLDVLFGDFENSCSALKQGSNALPEKRYFYGWEDDFQPYVPIEILVTEQQHLLFVVVDSVKPVEVEQHLYNMTVLANMIKNSANFLRLKVHLENTFSARTHF